MSLAERLIKLFSSLIDRIELDALIHAFEMFPMRNYKDLKAIERREEEEEEFEDVQETEGMCCMVYHCCHQLIEACINHMDCIEQLKEPLTPFVKGIFYLSFFHIYRYINRS